MLDYVKAETHKSMNRKAQVQIGSDSNRQTNNQWNDIKWMEQGRGNKSTFKLVIVHTYMEETISATDLISLSLYWYLFI